MKHVATFGTLSIVARGKTGKEILTFRLEDPDAGDEARLEPFELQKSLNVEDVIQLRKALGRWLDEVAPEHEAQSGEAAALPATVENAQLAALARRSEQQGQLLAELREALVAVPRMIGDQVGQAVADGLKRAGPAMAEQAAAAMASMRPGGNSGYMDATGRWRPPVAIQYGEEGSHLHGAQPLPQKRIENPAGPGGFTPPRGGVS